MFHLILKWYDLLIHIVSHLLSFQFILEVPEILIVYPLSVRLLMCNIFFQNILFTDNQFFVQVCDVYRLHRETYYLTMDYIDRYLSSQSDVPKQHLQLIGKSCFLVQF